MKDHLKSLPIWTFSAALVNDGCLPIAHSRRFALRDGIKVFLAKVTNYKNMSQYKKVFMAYKFRFVTFSVVCNFFLCGICSDKIVTEFVK